MNATERLKIHWVTEQDAAGNAFGYSVHNRMMKKYCRMLMDIDCPDADIAVTVTPADHFNPVPGKFNVLFTMWEFLDLPLSYIQGINKADALVVPSSFCRDLFRRYTDLPIYVCWEGVEPGEFQFVQRRFPGAGERFRFLWVGAPNPRKGTPLINQVAGVIEKNPQMELYIKTTIPDMDWRKTFRNVWANRRHIFRDVKTWRSLLRALSRIPRPGLANKVRRMGKHKNVIMDTRIIPREDLKAMYESAHCFLFPTFGEGWGLTLCEAMATGCPCVATPVTGVTDFFDEEVGFPIEYQVIKQDIKEYDLVCNGYVPDTKDFLLKMVQVFSRYSEALNRGRKASARIARKFTWDQSASRMEWILRALSKQAGRKAA